MHLFTLQVTRSSVLLKIKRGKKKQPKPFTPQKPQVICQKQVSEINYSFWFDEPLGKFLSSPSLTYSRTQNNHKPVRDVLGTLGSLCNFTAFDTVGDKPRGARNGFSWRGAVATNTMIHSGFQPAPYSISRKCHQQQAPSGGTVQKYLMQLSEIPVTFTGNLYFFLKTRHLILLDRKKLFL